MALFKAASSKDVRREVSIIEDQSQEIALDTLTGKESSLEMKLRRIDTGYLRKLKYTTWTSILEAPGCVIIHTFGWEGGKD